MVGRHAGPALELSLRAARPEREWDVINCGGVSYASYRLVPDYPDDPAHFSLPSFVA